MSTELRQVARTIDQPRIDAYADASGDHNPIHTDPALAATSAFGGTIAHGMLVLGLIGELMHEALGERWRSSGKLKVRFRSPARAADTVTASAERTPRGDGAEDYAVRCVNQAGDVLVEGRASVAALKT